MKDTFMNRVVFGAVVTVVMFGALALLVSLPGMLK